MGGVDFCPMEDGVVIGIVIGVGVAVALIAALILSAFGAIPSVPGT